MGNISELIELEEFYTQEDIYEMMKFCWKNKYDIENCSMNVLSMVKKEYVITQKLPPIQDYLDVYHDLFL